MSISQPVRRTSPLGAFSICAGLLCLGAGQAALADAPIRTVAHPSAIVMPPAPTHSTDLNSASSNPRADRTRKSPHDSSTAWANLALATDASGYVYSLWSQPAIGTMGIWIYDSTGNAGVVGPTYGPYADNSGTWAPYDLGVNPGNGHSKVLWDRSDGAMGVWTLDTSGNTITVGPTYGPFTDWTAIGIATGDDGSSGVLWKRSDGAMAEWILDSSGTEIYESPIYGPYASSDGTSNWAPIAIGYDPNDDTARVIWEYTDGTVGYWSLDAYGNYVTGQANTYGPISDSSGSWNPFGIATAYDGTSAVLWTRSDGAQGIWTLDANVNLTGVGPVYGPYSDSYGNWGAEYEGIGVNPNNDTINVLWDRSDGATGIWTLDSGGNETSIGPVYGPYD